MNVQEWLEKVKVLDERINRMIDKRDQLMAIATDVSAKPITDMPIDTGGTISQKMQDAVCALIDLDRELNKVVDEFIDHKRNVISAINNLPDFERDIFYRHYIKYESWIKIADSLGYSRMQLWRIRQGAHYILCQGIACYYEMC